MATVWSWALLFMVYVQSVVAYQFTVGGSKGWVLPSPSDKETYNQWAGRNRFQIGDTLLFKYNKTEDSVVQVRRESYNKCNTSGPIASYTDGNTVFKFPTNGPFYFISGNESRCQLGQKLIVVVLAPCHMGKGKNCKPASAPSPLSPSPSYSPQLSPNAPLPLSPLASPPLSPIPMGSFPSPSPTPTGSSPSPSLVISPALSPSPTPSLAPSPSPSPMGSSLSPSPSPSPLAGPALSPSPTGSSPSSSPSPSPLASPSLSPSPTDSSPSPSPSLGSPALPPSPTDSSPSPSPSFTSPGLSPTPTDSSPSPSLDSPPLSPTSSSPPPPGAESLNSPPPTSPATSAASTTLPLPTLVISLLFATLINARIVTI